MEKLKHFRYILLFEFKREAPSMGTMPSVRARQETGFLVLRRIVLTLVTLHVQEDLRDLMNIV